MKVFCKAQSAEVAGHISRAIGQSSLCLLRANDVTAMLGIPLHCSSKILKYWELNMNPIRKLT